MKKNLFTYLLLLIIVFLATSLTVSAESPQNYEIIDRSYEDGYYIETSISTNYETSSNLHTLSNTKYITKTKTISSKNSSGNVMWSLSIKATFSYNGKTAVCTSCSHSASAPGKTWTIKNASSSKSGNSATAKATIVHKDVSGVQNIYTRSVTIKCSANGTVS